ncbi:MAG: HAD family hydrolase, partial [Polymorphobacter sp.]
DRMWLETGLSRRALLSTGLTAAALAATPLRAHIGHDPLPSWHASINKSAILDYVKRITTPGSADFIAPEARIATFDNDGTLWCETPLIEGEFVKLRMAAMLKANPALAQEEPYKTLLGGQDASIEAMPIQDLLKVFVDTHTGMTEAAFAVMVADFFKTARHPKYNVPYTQMVYQPMLELLALLRDHGFVNHICSGGEVSFMRVISAPLYKIPQQYVIGTIIKTSAVENPQGQLELLRTGPLLLFNDTNSKVVGIQYEMGLHPVFVAGNVRSGGDIGQMRWSKQGALPSLQVMINHDDAVREAAYAEPKGESLAAAAKFGFNVVSIKNDWKKVFAFQG